MKKVTGYVLSLVGIITLFSVVLNWLAGYSPIPGEAFSAHWIGYLLGKLTVIALAVWLIYYGRKLQRTKND